MRDMRATNSRVNMDVLTSPLPYPTLPDPGSHPPYFSSHLTKGSLEELVASGEDTSNLDFYLLLNITAVVSTLTKVKYCFRLQSPQLSRCHNQTLPH
jgi:hypothetical protein